ncbi:uncharacterized protein VTP21DRAFT_11395 [Calcarisporiella thermophila]|uniref:uncharacterized protein n=1 Tax=Calcarisporiella thermophila TaxID=911321 RepID=UPI003743F5D9
MVLKGADSYKAINEYWSDLAELDTTAIVQPANVRDARPSHSGSKGGLPLGPGLLNTIKYSTKSKTVALGPGARCGEVDKHLAIFGRVAVYRMSAWGAPPLGEAMGGRPKKQVHLYYLELWFVFAI